MFDESIDSLLYSRVSNKLWKDVLPATSACPTYDVGHNAGILFSIPKQADIR